MAEAEYAKDSAQEQIDYAFGLVEIGSVLRECNVQIDLTDVGVRRRMNRQSFVIHQREQFT